MISIGPIVLYGVLLIQSVFYYLWRPRKFLNFVFFFIALASVTGLVSALVAYFLLRNSTTVIVLNGLQVAYAFYYLTVSLCWLAGINMYHHIASNDEQASGKSKVIFKVSYIWGCIQMLITIIIFAGLSKTSAYPRLIILNVCLIWPYLFIYSYLHLKNHKSVPTGVKIMLYIFIILNSAALIYNSVLCFKYLSDEAVLRTTYAVFFVIDFLQVITLIIANYYNKDLPIMAGSERLGDSGPGFTLGSMF